MRRWPLTLLALAAIGCKQDPPQKVVPLQRAAAPAATATPAPQAAAPNADPPPSPDPLSGKFTLADATTGLPGKGPLVALLDIEKAGQPLGSFHCDLWAETAPLAVANFVGLARGLRPFRDPRSQKWVKRPLYDGMHFHRVVPEFMIQAGDPHCQGDPGCMGLGGTGEPGYFFADEVKGGPRMGEGGLLAMANRGPGTNGSQFFITERAAAWLTGHHTIFGHCAEVELVKQISAVPRAERDMPKEPVVIKKVTIRRKVG